MVDWARVRYFAPDEFGGAESADRLNPLLIAALDAFRARLGVPIIPHAADLLAVRPATPDSQHPRGNAVDCHAEGLPLGDFWLAAEQWSVFGGIGLYPYWRHPGLHLDVRQGLRARWWRDARGQYHPVTYADLVWLAGRHVFMAGAASGPWLPI